MARKKVRLAWIENNSTRKSSLKKKRLSVVESTALSFCGDGNSSLAHHLEVQGPSFYGSSSVAPDHGLPFSRLLARVNFD
ncbi:hypothetical protein Gogos_009427, partial [Gossypium gossypioides]|nr:hypothetical protein [Gossypium gossypioides]